LPISEVKNNLSHSSKKTRLKIIRSCVVPVRFTPNEKEQLKENAFKFHLSISELIRRFSLRRKLPPAIPEVNIKTYRELAAIGNNLNQLMRELYLGIFRGVDEKFFYDLKNQIKKVSLEVIGNP
jgi:hypothetical protein